MKINSDLIDGIIESGSNTNGNWIKFIDGTLLQYGIFTTDQYKFTVAYGSVYWAGSSVIINFPINFLTDTFPTVNASPFIPGGIGGLTISTLPNHTGFRVNLWHATSYTFNNYAKVEWQAIGKWK